MTANPKFQKGQRVQVKGRTRYKYVGSLDVQEYTSLPHRPFQCKAFTGTIQNVFFDDPEEPMYSIIPDDQRTPFEDITENEITGMV